MNWTQIKCILYSLAIALIVYLVAGALVARGMHLRRNLAAAGRELATGTNFTRLVRIDPAVERQLTALLTCTTRVVRVFRGDVDSPFVAGKATGCVVLSNTLGNQLGIRLRHVGDGAFEAIGAWTPPRGDEPQ